MTNPTEPPPPDDIDADVTDESLLDSIEKVERPAVTKWDTET
jgi:hypothetical protein